VGMFKMKMLEKYLYDMLFFSCTDPHDASEMMSNSVRNSWFNVTEPHSVKSYGIFWSLYNYVTVKTFFW
jgi:hypothetical protein